MRRWAPKLQSVSSIPELVDTLRNHPDVLGLVEFGRAHYADDFAAGDYDLLVILRRLDYPVTSIHFYIGDTPIDLNLRTIEQFRLLPIAAGFERTFIRGRVIYDPTEEVAQIIAGLQQKLAQIAPDTLNEHEIARIRHWHRHVLDKVHNRLSTEVTFCTFLLQTNISWLILNFFRIHGLEYEGPRKAFDYLEHRAPEIYGWIQQFYAAADLDQAIEITHTLSELILQPIGGMWRKGEILAFGELSDAGLPEQGVLVYQALFGE